MTDAGKQQPAHSTPIDEYDPNPPQKDQRVSEVIGERVCTNCGFNLFGQPILREHHYNMLIVRCPECGTVAALQEYPLLGKWANRWSKLLAAAWLLAIILGVLVTTAVIETSSESISTEIVSPCAVKIGKLFEVYRLKYPEKYGKESPYAYWYNQGEPFHLDSEFKTSYIDGTWWAESGKQKFIHSSEYKSTLYDWSLLYRMSPVYVVYFVFGVIWSVVLIGAGKGRLFIMILLLGLLAMAASFLSGQWETSSVYGWAANFQTAQTAASNLIAQPVAYLTIAISLIPITLGMIFGRTIVRWLVIALYPPRMRGWLAFLWIEDGKTPPKKTWLDR